MQLRDLILKLQLIEKLGGQHVVVFALNWDDMENEQRFEIEDVFFDANKLQTVLLPEA
jgi:hypothetical protein